MLRRLLSIIFALALALALPIASAPARAESGLREQVCAMIDKAAQAHDLPVSFLTRLIWHESGFRTQAVSPKGAQGIAQFMPGTAAERGLADPFDPEQAIPKAAEFLAELRGRFGNLGLAAAAYNGGPNRVAAWLAGTGGLPFETRNYVELVTRHAPEDWQEPKAAETLKLPGGTCLEIANRIVRDEPMQFAGSALTAPWGVQIAGAVSRGAAVAAFSRARRSVGDVLTGEPMIMRRRVPGRGFAKLWLVRAPAQSRGEAEALCAKIHRAGGACAVLRT